VRLQALRGHRVVDAVAVQVGNVDVGEQQSPAYGDAAGKIAFTVVGADHHTRGFGGR
jgi:hypothetical protein